MNKHEVKHHRNSDTKTANRDHIHNHRLGTVSIELLGGGGGLKLVLRVQRHPPSLMWYKHLVAVRFA